MIPRKRRTREHIIADQSINHLERFIIDAGHVAERVDKDYGYDLLMMTFDEDGYAEPGLLLFQVKASQRLTTSGADYVFDIDIRDYNLWIGEARREYWSFTRPPAGRPFGCASRSISRSTPTECRSRDGGRCVCASRPGTSSTIGRLAECAN